MKSHRQSILREANARACEGMTERRRLILQIAAQQSQSGPKFSRILIYDDISFPCIPTYDFQRHRYSAGSTICRTDFGLTECVITEHKNVFGSNLPSSQVPGRGRVFVRVWKFEVSDQQSGFQRQLKMFRNQYDTDITTYSPQGRLHQVEYAMEAVKQGSAVVGLRSDTHVVLAALKRSTADLASHQKKLSEIDTHVGIAIAGLTADARVLSRFMRNECLNHSYVYGSPMPVSRLALAVADKCQISTQRASKRPYGVGLLIAGYDSSGPHLFQTCPSGNYFEYVSIAIGARSQSAKTYLERTFTEFSSCDLDALTKHAVTALRETVSSSKDTDLTVENTSVAVVGKGMPLTIFEDDKVKPFLDALHEDSTGALENDDSSSPSPLET